LNVADTLRDSSIEAVKEMHEMGVRTVMLTGDKSRLRALGIHVLSHALQRRRCVPQRLKPKRITGSDKSHDGH
jgi:hypothetical protein